MKYQTLCTTDPEIAKLQSHYRSTWHIVHLIISVLFFPWIVIWIMQGVSNSVHNKQIDNEIEQIVTSPEKDH